MDAVALGCVGAGTMGDAGRSGLVGDTWSATVGMHWHDDADAVFFFPPQLSGADPECSCDEGDEISRKKRSRNL